MFVRITGRVRINVASLNAQGTVGNMIELAKAHLVVCSSSKLTVIEVPVITGNTFKHWHFAHFIEQYKLLGGNQLCEYCRRLIGFRSTDKNGKNEEYFVQKCAGEDLHGFLQPENQVRRDSLVKTSFIVPVEGFEARIDTVTHNRVVVDEQGVIERGEGEETAMMVFKRQYASALYGFQIDMDLGYVGRLLYSSDRRLVLSDQKEVERRGKAALLALIPLLSGQMGASRSRAKPIWKVEELVAAWSTAPLPALTHGHYADYLLDSVRTLSTFSKLLNRRDVHLYVFPKELSDKDYVKKELKDSGIIVEGFESWQALIQRLVNDYKANLESLKRGS